METLTQLFEFLYTPLGLLLSGIVALFILRIVCRKKPLVIHTQDKEENKNMTPEIFVEKLMMLPYSRVIIPDFETQTYTGEILEFRGCITQDDTVQKTYNRIHDAATSWLLATIDQGQMIPLPKAMRTLDELAILEKHFKPHFVRDLTFVPRPALGNMVGMLYMKEPYEPVDEELEKG